MHRIVRRNLSNTRILSSNGVGFIGLGNMGGPMAQNLLKAGMDLHVYDGTYRLCIRLLLR